MPLDIAVIDAVPAVRPLAKPVVLTVAIATALDDQTLEPVRFFVVPSVNVPVAVNCCVVPARSVTVAGVTARETSVGDGTVSMVLPDTMPPEKAAIRVEPDATAVANPVVLIVAVAVEVEVQLTLPVMFCVVPLLNVPVAVNCKVRPGVSDGFAGVTVIDDKMAAETVSVADPEMLPEVALIVVVPTATAVASPAALMVAVAGVPEAHVTLVVMFCVVPLLSVPVAVNCRVSPAAIDKVAGVTAMETKVGGVTVRVVEPEMFPEVAVIVVAPAATAVASPAVLIVAAAGVLEFHVALEVRFSVVPLLSVPVAVNCRVSPVASEELAGVTAMDTKVAAVAVSPVDPWMLPEVAVMVVVPGATAVASPAALIVAAAGVLEAHVTLAVSFCVVPSLNVPVAVNCCVVPAASEGFVGVTAIDTNVGAATVFTTTIGPRFTTLLA
jgi:hypothetical protein